MDKESISLKIDCRLFVLSAFLLLAVLYFYNITCFASPMYDDSVSANLTIAVVKDYIDNKVAQNGATDNVFIDNGSAVMDNLEEIRSILPSEIQAFTYPSATAPSIIDTSDLLQAYNNNDLSYFVATFNLQTTNDLSNLDDYFSQYSDYIVNNIQSDVIAYYPINIDDVSSFSGGYPNSSHTISKMIGENFFNHDLYPCLFYRTWDSWGSYSLKSVNGGQDCKGYVLTNVYLGDWNFFVNNFDFIRKNGFIPKNYDYRYALHFQCYGDSGPYPGGSITTNKIGSENFRNLITFDNYDYYSSEGTTRHQTAIFTNRDNLGIPVLFFRNSASFEKFYNGNSRFAIPYDFNIEFPDTDFSSLDFTQILNAIRDSSVLESQNLQELYKHLNQTISQGIQDIIDGQKTTNELLLALLRYFDKNIVRDDYNITDILNNILSAVNNINVSLDFTDSDYSNLSDEVNSLFDDSRIKQKLDNTFPFSVKRDYTRVLDYFNNIQEQNPRFVFNFDLFNDEVHDYVQLEIDLTQIPGIYIFRSIFHVFVIILFNFSCFKLYDKFLTWYLS